jgi:hypothetical protein
MPESHLTIEDLNKLSDRLSAHADAITNAAAHHISDDMRLSARCCDWIAAVQNELGDVVDSVTKQVHEWRANGLGDISREELVDELEGTIADISRILARVI